MPATNVYALRYQALTDPPNGATLGQNLAEDVEAELVRIDAQTQGRVVKRGERTTDKTGMSTEAGVLRVDNITLVAGRRYHVRCTPARGQSTVGTDIIVCKLRVNQTGVATTASPQISSAEAEHLRSMTLFGGFTAAAASTACSVIFTAQRVGTGTFTLIVDGALLVEIVDAGVDPGDTGVDL